MDNKYSRPALVLLLICLFFSLASLGIYFDESDYPDVVLFSLLSVIRYSAFILCVSSVFILVNSTITTIRKPTVLSVGLIVLAFLCALFGAALVITEAFIITFAGGLE